MREEAKRRKNKGEQDASGTWANLWFCMTLEEVKKIEVALSLKKKSVEIHGANYYMGWSRGEPFLRPSSPAALIFNKNIKIVKHCENS